MNKKKIIPLAIIGSIILIGLIYLFVITRANNSSQFNKGTTLVDRNLDITIDASNKTEDQIIIELETLLKDKTIDLIQREKVIDSIPLSDVNAYGDLSIAIDRAKKMNDQISGFDKFKEHSFDITITFSLDEEIFSEYAQKLHCLNDFIQPTDAYIYEEDCEMKIAEADTGTVTDVERLVPYVVKEFNKGKFEINLDEGNIYDKPIVSTKNKGLEQRVSIFNNCVNTKFTYTFGKESVTIPKETIYSWISLSDTNKIIFDDAAMTEYIKQLGKEYNTIKLNRKFVTATKEEKEIPAKTYGWVLDETNELEKLQSDLNKGGVISREPVWIIAGYGTYTRIDNNDFGNQYIEIDIPNQKLYLIIDGEQVITSDIVSGTKNAGHLTPAGAYKIEKIVRDSILTGPGEDKEGEVEFAFFFDNEKAIHDTALRSEFGGDIYVTDGTRGCVNVPTDVVRQLFKYIEVGFPVIIYE